MTRRKGYLYVLLHHTDKRSAFVNVPAVCFCPCFLPLPKLAAIAALCVCGAEWFLCVFSSYMKANLRDLACFLAAAATKSVAGLAVTRELCIFADRT